MIHVVQLSLFISSLNDSVCRSFEWFSLVSLSVHGSCRSFGSSCSSVSGSVGSVVQSVRSVCLFAAADQYSPAQTPKQTSRLLEYFTNDARSLYSAPWRKSLSIFFTQPIYKVCMYIIGQK